ncbi:MAG: serine/threonine protein kinase [Lachnospira sp.]|nr:serine/threonine protein kinase [Lachnospira sp.]
MEDSKYELICELARTKQSRVCIIRHKNFDCLRIAKFISKTNGDGDNIFTKVNLIKNLRHPNIPRIIDIEEDDNEIVIIKEYVEAMTLSKFLDEKSLRDKEIAKIMINLCNILEYMHDTANLLHMDLKPDNIMIDNNDELWLIDLGSVVSKNIETKVNTGSPTFAAPEQYLDETATIQSDIYGLGQVLAYMCQKKQTKDDRFKEIIKKATKHEKSQRYKSVANLKRALTAILEELEVTKETSKIIFVRGMRSGIGVTHICLSLAKWMGQFTRVSLIDQSTNNHLRTEGLKGVLSKDGSLELEGFNVIPNYNNFIEVNDDARVKIVDFSGRSENYISQKRKELTGFEDVTLIECLVLSGGPALFEEILSLKNVPEETLVFMNLLSAKDFYECIRLMDRREIYRIPCIYNYKEDYKILDETLAGFREEHFNEFYWKGRKKIFKGSSLYEFLKTNFDKFKKKF